MKKLLDPMFDPPLHLLKYLYTHNPYQTITYFSESLELDRRTILKTIRMLQKDISINNWQDLITLKVIDKNISATFGPLFSIETFYSYYMSKSFGVNLTLRLFTHQKDSDDVLYEDNRYIYGQATRFFDFINQKKTELHVDIFQKFQYTLLLRRIIFSSLPTLQILVCSKVGVEEQHWLEERILNLSTVPVQFHINWSTDLDLVISDFPLPQRFIPENPDAYFLWLAFSSFSEWIQLIKQLEKIYFDKFYNPT